MVTEDSCRIVVLYDGVGHHLEVMAQAVFRGASLVHGTKVSLAEIRTANKRDISEADALILGSPNWSGISGSMKLWLDEQGDLWEDGTLEGKIGAAFASGRGRHSGLEFTLLSILHWMLACGMIVVGLPWSDSMETSGSYYGATAAGEVNPDDLKQAEALGTRVADFAVRLRMSRTS